MHLYKSYAIERDTINEETYQNFEFKVELLPEQKGGRAEEKSPRIGENLEVKLLSLLVEF